MELVAINSAQHGVNPPPPRHSYTDKKEKNIFLVYKEIQRDRVQSLFLQYFFGGFILYFATGALAVRRSNH